MAAAKQPVSIRSCIFYISILTPTIPAKAGIQVKFMPVLLNRRRYVGENAQAIHH
jgi:hypothetical protein